MRRAQGAIEFTLITTIMMLLFAASFIVIEMQFLEVQEQRTEENAKEIVQTIEREIQLANQAGEGYERIFNLPSTLKGIDYDIVVNENQTETGLDEIIIIVGDKQYITFVKTNMTGNISKGDNLIIGGGLVNITPLDPPEWCTVSSFCSGIELCCNIPGNTAQGQCLTSCNSAGSACVNDFECEFGYTCCPDDPANPTGPLSCYLTCPTGGGPSPFCAATSECSGADLCCQTAGPNNVCSTCSSDGGACLADSDCEVGLECCPVDPLNPTGPQTCETSCAAPPVLYCSNSASCSGGELCCQDSGGPVCDVCETNGGDCGDNYDCEIGLTCCADPLDPARQSCENTCAPAAERCLSSDDCQMGEICCSDGDPFTGICTYAEQTIGQMEAMVYYDFTSATPYDDLTPSAPVFSLTNQGGNLVSGGMFFAGGTARLTASETLTAGIIEPVVDTNEISVETWLTPSVLTQSGPARVVTVSSSNLVSDTLVQIGYGGVSGGNGVVFRLRTSTATDAKTLEVPDLASDTFTPIHVVVTFASPYMKMYVNGQFAGDTYAGGDLSNWVANYPLVIGNENTANRPFQGSVSKVAFFDEALDPLEIELLYAAGPGIDSCTPSEEICDGIDNDCNGLVDDGDACPLACIAVGESCTTSSECEYGNVCCYDSGSSDNLCMDSCPGGQPPL